MSDFVLPPSALALTVPYLQAVLANNQTEALRIALEDGLARGVSAAQLQLGMLMPAQREIGRLWQENVISVAQEHLATSISQLVLSHLYPYLPRAAANGRSVVVACVPGELHDLGARIGADFLEMAGFTVYFLGANVPTEALITKVREVEPDLLGLSCTLSFHFPGLRAAVAAVRSVAPHLPIAVGGAALDATPGLARELGVQAVGESAEQLAAECQRLFALSPTAGQPGERT